MILAWATLALAGEVRVIVDARGRKDRPTWQVVAIDPAGVATRAVAVDDGTDVADEYADDRMSVAVFPDQPVGRGRVVILRIDRQEEPEYVTSRTVNVDEEGARVSVNLSAFAEAHAPATTAVPAGEVAAFPTNAVESDAAPPPIGQWNATAMRAFLAFAAIVVAFTGRRLSRLPRPPPGASAISIGAALAALGFVILPPLPRLGQEFLGIEYVDHYGTQWFYWFAEYAIRTQADFGHTDLFFHPWGKDIYKHTGANILDGILAVPFRMLLGGVAGYNAFILVVHAISGVAFYALAREFVRDRVAAATAAVFFLLQPYILLEFQEGRPTQAFTVLPILFCLFLFRSGRRQGWVSPVLGGVFLALTGYQYWFYAIFGGVVAVAHGLWLAAFPGPESGGRWRVLARHALMAAVALLIAAPAAAPMVAMTSGGEKVPGLIDADLWSIWATPPTTNEGLQIGIFTWQPLRQGLGVITIDDQDREVFIAHVTAFPWAMAVVVASWLWLRTRVPRALLVIMLITVGMTACGPVILAGNAAWPNLPYIAAVKLLGPLQRLWWPCRAIVYAVILGSVVLAGVFERWRRLPLVWQAVAFGGTALWWCVDLHESWVGPFPTWDGRIPAGYRCLAARDGEGGSDDGALIELPYAWTQAHLYYQTEHHRPILGGMLEDNATFTPAEFTAFRSDNELVKKVLYANLEDEALTWSEDASTEVYDKGYRYVVVQKDAFYSPFHPEGQSHLNDLIIELGGAFGQPVYDDARLTIFAPWGDGAPCALDNWPIDFAPLGQTEQFQRIREYDKDRQAFWRVFSED